MTFRSRARRNIARWQRKLKQNSNKHGKPMFKLIKQMVIDWLLVSCALLMMLFVEVTHDRNGFSVSMSLQYAHNRIHWLCIATEPTGNGKPTGK